MPSHLRHPPPPENFPEELDRHEAAWANETEEGELIAGYIHLAGMATASTEPDEPPMRERWYASLAGVVGIIIGVLGVAAVLYGMLT